MFLLLAATVFEDFLIKNWWSIGAVIVIATGTFLTVKDLKKDVEDHHDPKNPNPHPNCTLHSAMLVKMDKQLDRIEAYITPPKKHGA